MTHGRPRRTGARRSQAAAGWNPGSADDPNGAGSNSGGADGKRAEVDNRQFPECRGRLADILEVLAGLESDRAPRGDADFLAGAGVAAYPTLARLHLEDAEPAQFDSFTALHRDAHRVEHRVDGELGLDLRDVGNFRNLGGRLLGIR